MHGLRRAARACFCRSVSVSATGACAELERGGTVSTFKPFDLLEASGHAAVAARDALGGAVPDVCLFFTSMADGANLQQLPDVLYRALGRRVLLFGGEAPPGVAGGFLQGLPAVSLLCLSLGERARAHMLHIDAAGALPTVDGLEWEDLVSRPPERSPGVVLLGSARFDPTPLLSRLDLAMPFAPKVGGTLPSLALYAGGEWRSGGAAGLVLDGEVALDAVVSQGAVGLGDELTITATDERWITELDGLDVVDAVRQRAGVSEIPPESQLFVGVGVDSTATVGAAGVPPAAGGLSEYVVRAPIAIERERGILLPVSPELLQPGRRVRFHAFGAIQAQDELRRQCRLLRDQLGEGQAAGALMVPCAARGMQLFGDCGVEESIVREVLQQPDLPLAGFFAGGELGPCGLRTYTHTFTTAMAVLRAR